MGVPAVIAGLALALLGAPPARAAGAEPGISTTAWYWEDQKQQGIPNPGGGGDAATVNAPNPFCPAAEGAGAPEPTCKSGRLPIEVRGGDYETPNMLPAVAFDLTLVPLGSTVSKFTVTFLEASDEQSQPVNAEGKSLQACIVDDVFGAGEARLYKEVPKFDCPKQPIVGKRAAVGGKEAEGPGPKTFEWTFDLTRAAKDWVAEGAFATGVLIRPLKPKQDAAEDGYWRVVLAGPEEKKGITTQLTYTPAPLEDPAGDPFASGGSVSGGGGTSLGGSGGLSGSGLSGDGSAGLDTGSPAGEPGAGDAGETDDAAQPVAASERLPEIAGGLPAYVWLGMLLGVAGFSLLRAVVVEKTAGARPDGVLAQIRRLNAQRRGAAPQAASTTSDNPLNHVRQAARRIGDGTRALLHKLPARHGRT